jgi:hypothetical protein
MTRAQATLGILTLVAAFALGAAWGYEQQVESCGQMVRSGEALR